MIKREAKRLPYRITNNFCVGWGFTPAAFSAQVIRHGAEGRAKLAEKLQNICITRGRGEVRSPAGDRRSPLRINKFDMQKAKR